MLTNSNITDLYYKIDRKNNKLSDECLEKLYEIKMKLNIPIKIVTNDSKDASIDKVISDLKSNLNKLTEKNYTKVSNKIIIILENYNTTEFFKKVSKLLFDLITVNKFNINIYCKLYVELCNIDDYFKQIVKDRLKEYYKNFEEVKYISPTENYNDYCNYIKESEKIITESLFFLGCYNENNIFNIEDMIEILNKCFMMFKENMNYVNNCNICEKILENIFVIINGIPDKENKNIINIKNELNDDTIKKMKNYNNKIRFKIMDLNEIFNN